MAKMARTGSGGAGGAGLDMELLMERMSNMMDAKLGALDVRMDAKLQPLRQAVVQIQADVTGLEGRIAALETAPTAASASCGPNVQKHNWGGPNVPNSTSSGLNPRTPAPTDAIGVAVMGGFPYDTKKSEVEKKLAEVCEAVARANPRPLLR